MLDKQKQDQYNKFKNSIFGTNHPSNTSNNNSNTTQSSVSDTLQDLDHEQTLQRARVFIHRIKDHRHNKIRNKQINKFERLFYKIRGYHHNLIRHNNNLDNINQNSSFSGQPTVPSSSSPTTSTTSTTSNVPATPVPPTPSIPTTSNLSAQGNPTSGITSNQHTCRTPLDKWVINLSNTPLSIDQLTLLQKGPNFAIIPKHPPIEAYITATEMAAAKLPTQEAEEFKSDVNRLLKLQQQHHQHCNLTPAQHKALTQLKQDNNRVILTADKGVAMVVMDTQDYNNKAQALLQDSNTYQVLPKDPTPNLKTNSSPSSKTYTKQEASAPTNTNSYTQQVPFHLNSMAFLKSIKQVLHSGP